LAHGGVVHPPRERPGDVVDERDPTGHVGGDDPVTDARERHAELLPLIGQLGLRLPPALLPLAKQAVGVCDRLRQ
jgi:hypothetical protein